ncbi:BEL1-like homeodomain protein 4 [Salvia hispanica]|uniref:BEL1-like homeodomain protein 4 n=1 Tax=Salvia hispanica TaxID=49212 RepID=UPI002009B00E|nr:BEL1-like homeodomain protein 4 [Salvia hispanica]
MGIATTTLPPVTSHYNSLQFSNSMSQDYHQGIFSFSNGFERSQQEQQQHHIAQQIRRDKLRVQGFEPPPPPLVGMEEEEAVYENPGMLSEMFTFQSAAGTATELLESQILQSYRNPRAADWFPPRQGMVVGGELGETKNQHLHHQPQHQIPSINADSAAAMQLFLMNPQQQQQQPRSPPSPSPSHPPPQSTSSTLHMLLPHHSSSSAQALHGGGFEQFTWLPGSGSESNPIVEGQGLSLSLSSHLEAAKAEELRMGDGNMLFFGQGGAAAAASIPAQYQLKNLGGGMTSPYGAVNMLRSSKYAKAAQELLEEFCSVGRGHFKKSKLRRQNNNSNDGIGNPNSNPNCGNSSSSSKDNPPLSAADRLEHQRRKVKLLSMLDEVDRRYNHYCEQMQMVVNSFDMVMGFGAAVPYTSLAQKAMSRHFRCLKDAIAAQLKHSCELLGEKDAGTSGVTKGETPRLRMLDQSLRQQRAFHQMGIMEQEAWRPQRGLPERSVNILRAWLFEHFLHPYPSDADKHLLARQTGLSRNQVSNWFINARVRLWKPMVEEMYQQEAKDEPEGNEQDRDQSSGSATPTTTTPPPISAAPENDPSFIAINRQCYTDNNGASASTSAAADDCRDMQVAGSADNIGSTVIRFGANAGDVSLTLGLRHAGNLPEKSPFSIRDFGGC